VERFEYKAKTKEGKDAKGKVEARDLASALGVLREKGMVVVEIKPVNEVSGVLGKTTTMMQKVSGDDIVAFTRQFSTMVASGLALTESLSVLEMQSRPAMSRVISEVLREVQGGNTLADAMDKQSQVFSGVYVSLIRAGEASGALDEVLKRLADNLEKQKEFKGKVKGALIYPVIVVIGMIAVTVVMMVFVIPKLADMYQDFDADLPWMTQLLIAVSNMFQTLWPVMLLGSILAGAGFFYWKSTPVGRKNFDTFVLKLPVFGKLQSEIVLAEMARTLSLLVGAGISLLDALEIVGGVLGNKVFEEAIDESMKQVKKGMPLSVTLARANVFPPLLPNMVAVGEETGKMDEVLMKVANYFEVESEHTVKNLTTALEPIIMIVLGLGVGFLVISIIMPIYQLTSQF